MRALPIGLLATSLISACDLSGVTLSDDVSPPSLFGPRLSTPYAPGLELTLRLSSSGPLELSALEPRSSDEDVLLLSGVTPCAERCLEIEAHAGEPGVASLQLIDDAGQIVYERELAVAVPDGLRLYPAPEVFQRGNDDGVSPLDLDDEIRVVVGRTATFLVGYYRQDGGMVSGNGVLEPRNAEGVDALAATSTLVPHRDWLQLLVDESGLHEMELVVGGHAARLVRVRGVPESDVARLELSGELDLFLSEGSPAEVVARAFDAEGRRVFGVEPEWTANGATLVGAGDFVTYTKGSSRRTLRATVNGREASAVVQATSVSVRSSNDLPRPSCACVTTTRLSSGLAAWLGFAGALGLLLGRRRRSGSNARPRDRG